MIQSAGNTSTSIAIFGWLLLGLVTTVLSDDGWWTSSNVLFDTNTPVYFFRSDKNSKFGHKLILQDNALSNLKEKRPHYFSAFRGNITDHDEEFQSDEWFQELNSSIKCVAPSIVYPKIVVFVDNGIYERHVFLESKLFNVLKYLVSVWNGVDLNFRKLEHPRVRLNIAGIVVADRADSFPFLSQFKHRGGRADITNVVQAFANFMETDGSSWSSHFGLYHTAVLMTSLDTNMRGWDVMPAYHSSRKMCTNIETKGPPGRVVLSDNGDWSRITRELTYYLGNSFETPVYEDGGGICENEPSVVTSWIYNNYRPEMPLWSKCSLDSFKKRFNAKEANCLHEKPNLTSPLPRLLPGRLLDTKVTCRFMANKWNCGREEEATCKAMLCHDPPNTRGEWDGIERCSPIKIHAPDGLPCGSRKICFDRKCVFEQDLE